MAATLNSNEFRAVRAHTQKESNLYSLGGSRWGADGIRKTGRRERQTFFLFGDFNSIVSFSCSRIPGKLRLLFPPSLLSLLQPFPFIFLSSFFLSFFRVSRAHDAGMAWQGGMAAAGAIVGASSLSSFPNLAELNSEVRSAQIPNQSVRKGESEIRTNERRRPPMLFFCPSTKTRSSS